MQLLQFYYVRAFSLLSLFTSIDLRIRDNMRTPLAQIALVEDQSISLSGGDQIRPSLRPCVLSLCRLSPLPSLRKRALWTNFGTRHSHVKRGVCEDYM
jgi:hypothetical protein